MDLTTLYNTHARDHIIAPNLGIWYHLGGSSQDCCKWLGSPSFIHKPSKGQEEGEYPPGN